MSVVKGKQKEPNTFAAEGADEGLTPICETHHEKSSHEIEVKGGALERACRW